MMLLALIMSAAAPPPPAPSSAGVELRDEGVVKGYARVINCTGSGVTCTLQDAGFGTIDVTSGGGGGGAPTTAQYWVGTADGTLSAEKNLGALSTGLVINTAGTPSAYAGATCGAGQYASAVGSTGTLTCSVPVPASPLNIAAINAGYIDAGRVVENGVRVASSATDPLVLADGNMSCTAAAAGQAGCVSTATQTFEGSKYVTGTFGINGSVSGGAFGNISLLSTKGIAIGDRISPYNVGGGIIVTGDRAAPDLAGTLVVESARWRDAGVLFNVQYPTCSGSSAFSVTDQGIYYGQALQPGCTSASNPFIGGLVDYSTASGHISHRAVEDYYLTLGGSLGHRTDAVLPDGGRPVWVDGGSVGVLPDGGTYLQYGGEHGDVGLVSIYPRTRGFIAEFYNPNSGTSARTDHKAFIDWNGAYSQNNQLELTQFPPIAATSTDTNLGSFFDGALVSSIYYDFRPKASGGQHWYFAQDQGDGGGAYVQLLDTTAYATVEDEATPLTQRTTINFTGAGVSCTDSGGKTVCTIAGGGGGGGTSPLILSFGGF